MGVEANITHDQMPAQGDWLGRKVEVCYHYDTTHTHHGEIVREDAENPGRMIIRVTVPGGPDRYVMSSECQYSLVPDTPPDVGQVAAEVPGAQPEKQAMIAATIAEYARLTEEGKQVLPADLGHLMRSVSISENAIRVAMEVVFNSSVVTQPMYFVEMAIRLASYCISALPLEMQDEGIALLQVNIEDVHARRVANGTVMTGFWENGRLN